MLMDVLTLQEFLRNLSSPLAAVGVQSKSLDDLRAVAHTLEPFRDLDLAQLADFLKRAAELRQSGDIPAVVVPGLDDTMAIARKLSDSTRSLQRADSAAAGGIEGVLNQGKRDLQSALNAIAGTFGLTAKFTDDKKWLAELRARAATAQAVEAIRRLAPQITELASYQSEAVQSAIDRVARMEAKSLKAAASELGATGTGTGKKFVESLLVKMTGIDNKPPKAAKAAKANKKAKPAEPAATEEQVAAMIVSLQEMVARANDPNAVPDAEIETLLARVGAEFSSDQQKAIAKQVTGNAGKTAKNAIENLRADLTAVKRLLESQKV